MDAIKERGVETINAEIEKIRATMTDKSLVYEEELKQIQQLLEERKGLVENG